MSTRENRRTRILLKRRVGRQRQTATHTEIFFFFLFQ